MRQSRTIRALAAWAACATVVTVVAPRADAGTSTSAFEVTATVFASCTLSMGALALPSYVSGTATAVTGNANATVTCPGASAGRPVSVKIGIQAGAGAGPGSTLHPNIFEMDDGAGHVLTYSVKDDLGHAFAPNGTANPAFNETTNVADVHTFTATIPSLQGVPVGNYTQEDKATLTF